MISDNELYKALETIQKACDEMDINGNHISSCQNCRMGNGDGDCLIMRLCPCNWKLKKPEPITRLME